MGYSVFMYMYVHVPTLLYSETLGSGDNPHECWVTVFGFPSAASSYVLEQFSQYGTILRHSVSTCTVYEGLGVANIQYHALTFPLHLILVSSKVGTFRSTS